MPVKILHAADLHLDSPLRNLPDAAPSAGPAVPLRTLARSASRRAFENLIDLAVAQKVEVLLLAGDIFDGKWEDHHTGLFFSRELGRFTATGGRVFLARGNHDAECQMSLHVTLPEGVHTFSSGDRAQVVDLPDLGIAVHGWSFPTKAVKDDPTHRFGAPVPGRFNIGLLHTNLGGTPGHGNYAPTTLQGLVGTGLQYWALGHIHTRSVTEADGCTLVYPGNLQGRHARELAGDDGKGATLLTVEAGRIVSLEHRALDVLRWQAVEADVTDAQTLDACVRALATQVHDALSDSGNATLPVVLRVTLAGRTPAHGALLSDPAGLRASIEATLPTHRPVYLEKVKVQTRLPAVEGADPLADPLGRVTAAAQRGHLRSDVADALLRGLSGQLSKVTLEHTGDDGETTSVSLHRHAQALTEGDALDALLERARATLLHRLRG